MYPYKGFYSSSENILAVECFNTIACPGSMGEDSNYPIKYTSSGAHVTTQCSTLLGYTGYMCQDCLNTGYFKDGINCRLCEINENDKHEFIIYIIIAIIVFGFIAVFTVFLSGRYLDVFVIIVLFIQQSSLVGRFAAQ
jgi:hypothetical protein